MERRYQCQSQRRISRDQGIAECDARKRKTIAFGSIDHQYCVGLRTGWIAWHAGLFGEQGRPAAVFEGDRTRFRQTRIWHKGQFGISGPDRYRPDDAAVRENAWSKFQRGYRDHSGANDREIPDRKDRQTRRNSWCCVLPWLRRFLLHDRRGTGRRWWIDGAVNFGRGHRPRKG